MTQARIEIQGLDRLIRKTDSSIMSRPMRRFFDKSSTTVLNRATKNVTVDRGRLRSSLTKETDGSTIPLWAKVGTNVIYAKPVEYGTGIHSEAPDSKGSPYFPPPDALELWAVRHGFDSGFVVAQIIFNAGGTVPKPYLRPALEDSTGDIEKFLSRAADDIEKEWK